MIWDFNKAIFPEHLKDEVPGIRKKSNEFSNVPIRVISEIQ
jgi:hypothetical protein